MEIFRRTTSLCPECAQEVEATLAVDGGRACLIRECPEHGSYTFIQSENGDDYADLDRFYISLNGLTPQGNAPNVWFLITHKCQQNCCYCSADVACEPSFEEMSWDDLMGLLDKYGHERLSLAGGEPTLHPRLFEFLQEAQRRGISITVATNALALASPDFCRRLKEVGVKEVRVSIESLNLEQADALKLGSFLQAKLKAIDNLGALGITVTLSPTLFKGLSEDQVFHMLEYAKMKPFIREVTIEGFSWNGGGMKSLPKEMMLTPDAMMDEVHRYYCKCSRHDVFTFQKLLHALMYVLGIRYCLNSQAMIFLNRREKGLDPLLHYFNLRRLERWLRWWIRVKPGGRLAGGLFMLPVLASAVRLKTLPLVPAMLRLLFANLAKVKVDKYPSEFLILVLNTNCSTLNADPAVSAQCISRTIMKQGDVMRDGTAANELLGLEKTIRKSRMKRDDK